MRRGELRIKLGNLGIVYVRQKLDTRAFQAFPVRRRIVVTA